MPLPDTAIALRALELKKACDEAYAKFPTSCSHAVMYVVNSRVSASLAHRDANGLMAYLPSSESKWVKVTESRAQDLADTGVVVVAGLKKAGGHGHVVVIYPGGMTDAGGYEYFYTVKQVTLMLGNKGKHARCMSTSITSTKAMDAGFWPGTMSQGEKTVWDPWAKDEVFRQVEFYAQPGSTP